MTPKEIQIGTRLELELFNKNNKKVGSTYISQLLEQQENNLMMISAPIYEARLIPIPIQSEIRLVFLHNIYGLVGFTAIVLGRENRGNVSVLIIQPETELIKMQRRTHYRLDYITDAELRVGEKGSASYHKTVIKAFTKNISGSGACVITEVDIPKSSVVYIELNLTENFKIITRCIVVRDSEIEIKKVKNYVLGLHFTNISKKDQNSLIKFIFEQQRIQLKKEAQ
jgi:c-di-GMP-binding flagellar brake protein YcgR